VHAPRPSLVPHSVAVMTSLVNGSCTQVADSESLSSNQPRVSELDSRLVQSLDAVGIRSIFTIQRLTLSRIRSANGFERDMCIVAPTGSGKTLSYLLPVFQILSKCTPRVYPQALIMVPSQDLAIQICEVAHVLCTAVDLRIGTLGCMSGTQQLCKARRRTSRTTALKESLYRKESEDITRFHDKKLRAQITVTSPGRFSSIFSAQGSSGSLRLCVIDEADRMFQQSYQNWLAVVNDDYSMELSCLERRLTSGERIRRHIRKLLCSATLTNSQTRLLKTFAIERVSGYDDVATPTLPVGLKEFVIMCNIRSKFKFLRRVLNEYSQKKVILFASSASKAHQLCHRLRACCGRECYEYSGSKSQLQRASTLSAFQVSEMGVLVATDAAARGLDIDLVALVLSYDCPTRFSTYLHRVGRTARAGRAGISVLLCTSRSEVLKFTRVSRRRLPELHLDVDSSSDD